MNQEDYLRVNLHQTTTSPSPSSSRFLGFHLGKDWGMLGMESEEIDDGFMVRDGKEAESMFIL